MGVQYIKYDGLEAVELTTTIMRLIVITEVGPRIAYFGKKDVEKNILYWDKDGVNREAWKLYGGHRVWISRPYADESEDTYISDNQPCTVQQIRDGIRVTAPRHPFTKIERGMEIEIIDENRVSVTNFIKNAGQLIYSGGVWSPTCVNPEGKIFTIPLGEEDATWDIVTVVTPRVFAGNIVRIDDPQVTYEGNNLVVKSQGQVCKRCVNAPKGEISMYWPEEKLTFIKQSNYVNNGKYPFNNCNIAIFIGQDNWMGEMETFGVEQTIKPGETICNKEIWTINFAEE